MRVALLGGALLVTGCVSFLRPDGPRTQPPGTSATVWALSTYLGPRKDGNAINSDLLLRSGLTEHLDLGLRANFFGVAADLKWQLVRSPFPTCGFDLSVAPSVGYGADISWSRGSTADSEGSLMVGLPVLMAINLGNNQLLLTPQALYQRHPVLPDGLLHLGGTVAFGHTSQAGFHIYPALAVWKTLDPRHVIGSLRGAGQLAFQPSLVFRWGR